MARMLQALKNLEAKETRPQNTRGAAPSAKATQPASGASAPSAAKSPASAASNVPQMIEMVDKLDAVVGHELDLGYDATSLTAPAFGPGPAFGLNDYSFFTPPNFDVPSLQPPAEPPHTPPTAVVSKAPCELERQVKRTLLDSVRSQPLTALADRLALEMDATQSKILAFAGLGPSQGSHLPVLYAATLLAEKQSKKVLLIDGDLGNRFLTDGLEYGRASGLGEMMAGKADPKNCWQPTAAKDLFFLPAGQLQPVPDSSAAEGLAKMLAELKGEFDCLLIDAGNWRGETCSALARASDATYLVIELGAVETNAAQAGLARMRAAGARVLGCIAT